MKRKSINIIIIVAIFITLIFCLGACRKADPAPAESQKPIILENEGNLEIEVPDDQDTFGE